MYVAVTFLHMQNKQCFPNQSFYLIVSLTVLQSCSSCISITLCFPNKSSHFTMLINTGLVGIDYLFILLFVLYTSHVQQFVCQSVIIQLHVPSLWQNDKQYKAAHIYVLHKQVTTHDYVKGNSTYRLDTMSKESTVFRNPRAMGCSILSAARALLSAQGFLNTVNPVGHGI